MEGLRGGADDYLAKPFAFSVVTRTMLLEAVWDYHFDPQTKDGTGNGHGGTCGAEQDNQ